MMIPFVPRKVAQSSKATASASSRIQSSTAKATSQPPVLTSEETSALRIDSKKKGRHVDVSETSTANHSVSVWLALSDYAIWSDSHLRSRIVNGPQGYIPLRYLMNHSAVLTTFDPLSSETVFARAIRAQESDGLDVRVLVSTPSRAAWYGKGTETGELGGYEVRRRDWEEALRRVQQLTDDDWTSRTIYVENIPFQFRTTANIARFIQSLLSGTVSPPSTKIIVQHVWLPPHFRDKDGDQPRCKGFALVTLDHPQHAELMVREWPWLSPRENLQNVVDNQEAQEAANCGFRVLLRAKWEQLKEEYLAYRQTLLKAIASTQQQPERAGTTEDLSGGSSHEQPSAEFSAPALPITDLSSAHPQGCLVFVRNIHPETNKTTLRSLFSQAFPENDAPGSALDYVDFFKGMETCYLRLTSAHHTQLLTAYFTVHPKAQSTGLDTTGTPPSGTGVKAISLEVVEGTREELYWSKVPEKVRRQAVGKAAGGALQLEDGGNMASEPTERGRKRKRRKRNE